MTQISDDYAGIVTECIVATDGEASGNGQTSSPITWAAIQSLCDTMWPGVSIKLKSGTYSLTTTTTLSGNPNGFITISPNTNGVIIDGFLTLSRDFVKVKDILFINSACTDRETEIEGSNPADIDVRYRLKLDANHCIVIGCTVHDSGTLVNGYYNDTEISDCVVFYGGWSAPDRGHGHGIYLSGQTIKIKNCIVFDMFSYGIHCYGEEESVLLKDITVENCIIFGAGSLADYPMANILVGGTSGCHADHPVVKNCSTYHRGASGYGVMIGFGAYGYDGGTVQDSVIVGGGSSLWFRGEHGADGITDISGNWFGADVAGFTAEEWPDNTYSTGVPDIVKVYPSEYTSTLAHVAIFNGASANAVTVNLTTITGLAVGDNVTVANVQDLFVDIVTLTLDANKCISVDMRAVSHTVATPQGWTAPATTFPPFGCFVVEKV